MKIISEYTDYAVTIEGDVYSSNPKWINSKTPCRSLHKRPDKYGYPFVTISHAGKSKMCYVHRLVAEAYIPNPNNLPCVCHRDDNPSNNNVNNLFWGTYQDNTTDKVGKNRQARGETSGVSVLTEEQIKFIKNYPQCRGYTTILKNMFGVGRATIIHIIHGNTWKHVKPS